MEHEAWRDLVPFVDTLIERVDVRRDELVIRYRGLELVREALEVCGMSGMVDVLVTFRKENRLRAFAPRKPHRGASTDQTARWVAAPS